MRSLSNSNCLDSTVMVKLEEIAPLRNRLVKRRRCAWFSNELKLLCTNRDKLREEAKSTGDWKSYRVARNNVTLELSKSKCEYFKKKFAEKMKSKSLWDSINELTSYRKPNSSDIVTILDDDKNRVTDKCLINNILADKLFIHQEPPPDLDSTCKFIETFKSTDDEPLNISPEDIEQLINETKK